MKQLYFLADIDTENIQRLIRDCEGEAEIELFIDSCGGDPYASICFASFIKTTGIKLNVNVLSRCLSAAIFIVCVAERRKASKNSIFLIHPNRTKFEKSLTTPEVQERLKTKIDLDKILIEMICKSTGKSFEEIEKIYYKETELTAQKAFEFGLLTEEPY